MSTGNFERLKESIIEAGQVLRGECEPSRVFTRRVTDGLRSEPQPEWAVCVTTDDDALIPLKLYEIRRSAGGRVWVRDEAGETVICPEEWFMPMALTPAVRQAVASLTLAA